MTHSTSNYKFLFYLSGITLAGLLLRLNHLGTESITADEVSALLRLQFNSFGEMLNGGVKPDGHPAFTQVLLWFWIKCFGNSEFAIRIPFVLMGTASIWLAGITTRRWFGIGAALAVAGSLAFLQFTIMYSQLARPYAPGLFYTMLAAYFVSRFSQEEKVKWAHIIGFGLAGAGAAYSHYFSLLTTLLLGIGGIFLATKINRTNYFVACGAAVLLFIPHISFTISQMEIGGIGGPGGWLGIPTPEFFKDHLFFVFNESRGLVILVFAVAIACFIFNKRRLDKKQIIVCLLWLFPMLIGYFYSVYKNPVLQNSTLLFSFPFLLMFIFSWFPYDAISKWSYRFALLLIIPMVWYITVHKPFRLTNHFGRLDGLVEVFFAAEEKYGRSNVDVMFNVDDPYFVLYYLNQKPMYAIDDYWYTLFHTYKHDELLQLKSDVASSNAEYYVYGWSTRESSPASLDIIAEKFPCLVEKHEWFNSAVYVFAKNKTPWYNWKNSKHSSWFDYANVSHGFLSNAAGSWSDGNPYSQYDILDCNDSLMPVYEKMKVHYFILDSLHQYGPLFSTRVGSVISGPDNEIAFQSRLRLKNTNSEAVLVVEFIRNGKQILWTGMSTKTQIDSSSREWQHIYFVQRPPVPLLPTDSIKAYIFTPNMLPVDINAMEFSTREGHRGIYGNRPDYE